MKIVVPLSRSPAIDSQELPRLSDGIKSAHRFIHENYLGIIYQRFELASTRWSIPFEYFCEAVCCDLCPPIRRRPKAPHIFVFFSLCRNRTARQNNALARERSGSRKSKGFPDSIRYGDALGHLRIS